MKKHFCLIILLWVIFFVGFSGSLEAGRRNYYRVSWDKFAYSKKIGKYLDMSLAIVAPVSEKQEVEETVKEVFREIKEIYFKLSEYEKESDTSLVNRNAGIQPTPIGSDLARILIVVHKIYDMTGGRFDIVDKSLKKKVNLDDILLNLQEMTVHIKDKKVQIRVFELMKGYLAERAALSLMQRGWRHFLINAGGEIRASGSDLNKGSWVVHVQDPKKPRGRSICSVTLLGNAISTAGIYERSEAFYDQEEHRSRSDLLSVSVIYPDALMASALAVAAFREGSFGASQLIQRFSGAEGVIIHRGGHLETVGGASAACIQD
ncbi:MAG: hypothetical protein A3I75_06900 [Deltaproteobacteria bacterium RIFCSPLOWO2_02_FULL_50_16]|nr:MAG: hypothetical protein A3I75_06900 [Deltaproteobacteria bacterium RIFCSPLOWO2_02_FULL_50_16]